MTKASSNQQNLQQEFCRIEFEPVGRRGKVRKDQSLLESAHQLGVDIVSICGKEDTCNGCSVNGDADWLLEILTKKYNLSGLCIDLKLSNRLSYRLLDIKARDLN